MKVIYRERSASGIVWAVPYATAISCQWPVDLCQTVESKVNTFCFGGLLTGVMRVLAREVVNEKSITRCAIVAEDEAEVLDPILY